MIEVPWYIPGGPVFTIHGRILSRIIGNGDHQFSLRLEYRSQLLHISLQVVYMFQYMPECDRIKCTGREPE